VQKRAPKKCALFSTKEKRVNSTKGAKKPCSIKITENRPSSARKTINGYHDGKNTLSKCHRKKGSKKERRKKGTTKERP